MAFFLHRGGSDPLAHLTLGGTGSSFFFRAWRKRLGCRWGQLSVAPLRGGGVAPPPSQLTGPLRAMHLLPAIRQPVAEPPICPLRTIDAAARTCLPTCGSLPSSSVGCLLGRRHNEPRSGNATLTRMSHRPPFLEEWDGD